MGLDTTHDCWHGPYSYFDEWRGVVAKAAGRVWDKATFARNKLVLYGLWIEDRYDDPLDVLFEHSDCDGIIMPDDAAKLADALERLLPKIDGDDYQAETERFINGLREASDMGQVVEFH